MATGVGKTNYSQHLVLNALLRNTAFTPPATLYIALFTVMPDETGAGTEVSGGSYAREVAAWGAPADQSPTGSQCANSGLITFPVATAGWGTVVGWGLYDALTVGNLIYYALLTTPITVVTSQQPTFPASSLTVLED